MTRALDATREREADFRQAAFDLNAELLRKDAEVADARQTAEAASELAAARGAELADLRQRLSDLERVTQTRAFRAVTRWWRLKARILGRA